MNEQLKYRFDKFVRQGFNFEKTLEKVKKTEFYTAEEIDELQNVKLQKMINHCYRNIPYYRNLFTKLNLTPEDIKTKDDLKKLPLLDKKLVKENYDKLIDKSKLGFLCHEIKTSGSTSTPAKFIRDRACVRHENAMLWRFWQNAGDKGLKRVTLRGGFIVPFDCKTPPFWKFNPVNNELLMSAYHLVDENAEIYINKLKEFKPRIINAYPSAVYLLATYFYKANRHLNLRSVFTSSEVLLPDQKAFIEKVFNCKVYDWYGQAERVAAIGQCENGTYHIVEDYSISEIIDTEFGPELVGTSLENYVMPLLRYRTGDIIWLGGGQCSCGRHFRVVSGIQGRSLSYIVTPEGNKASLTLISLCIRDATLNIAEAQYVQEKQNELIVNIVKFDKFTYEDRQKVIELINKRISPNLKVTINEVESIPRGPGGKFIPIINKLPADILL